MNAPESLTPPFARPLNIALLGYRSHPHVGGQGIYLRYLSRALVDLGHRVDVISGPPYPELDPRVGLVRLPSLDLYSSEKPHKELRLRHFLSYTDLYEYGSKMSGGFAEPYTFSRRVAAYLRQRRSEYDLVHDNQCLGYGLLNIAKLGIPLVATIHHPITRDRSLAEAAQSTPFMKRLTRRWYRFVDMQIKVAQQLPYLTTVSEFTRQDISQAFQLSERRIRVIANGVDSDLFRPLPHVSKRPFHLITTASSDQPLKGLRFLLLALARLRQRFPDVSLTIIGALKAEGECEQLVATLGLDDCIDFQQNLSHDALVSQYNLATVAVTPSLYEGFGLPAAEAMACGTAVVTSDGGALPEVVGDAGLVVPAGDHVALAQAIGQLLVDAQMTRRLAELGRERINTQFRWANTALALEQFYRFILQQQASALCTPSTANV